jgi:membrane dipeptidase
MTSLLLTALLLTGGAQTDEFLVRARALHRQVPLIDGHNDLPWRMRGLSRTDPLSLDISQRLDAGQTDIPRLREGGLGAQFWSVYVPASLEGREAVTTTRNQISLVYKLVKKYPNTFEIAWTADDVERIFRAGRIASMIGMEGGHSINGSLETLRDMYRLGARYMTLTHSRNTPWADSATDDPRHNGLTAFGKKVVLEMNKLGMLVDLSHVSAKTMHDALDVSKAPVIFSHSGAYALCRNPRNVPDDVLRRLPKNGGVVMVVFFRPYTSQAYHEWQQKRAEHRRGLDRQAVGASVIERQMADWEAKNPAPEATLQQVANQIDHIRKVAGVDAIGIGSDFDGGGGVAGLEDVSKYPHLTAELLRRGYSDEDVKKILGLNVLRVMRQAEKVAAQMKGASLSGTAR